MSRECMNHKERETECHESFYSSRQSPEASATVSIEGQQKCRSLRESLRQCLASLPVKAVRQNR